MPPFALPFLLFNRFAAVTGELSEKFLLFLGKFGGCFDEKLHYLVATSPAFQLWNTLPSYPDRIACLGSSRNGNVFGLLEGRHFYFLSQGRLGKRDGDAADDVVSVSGKY